MAGLISGQGESINLGSDIDLKEVYYRFKDGESAKVRVLGLTDYAEYKAHGDFNLKVYTQPCVAPLDRDCPLCTASKSGVDGFDKLYTKKRYLFVFGDLATGKLKVWDCSKSQAKDLLTQINEYKEDIGEVAFNFKRTGNKTETSYKLNPILKLKGKDVDDFHAFDDMEIPPTFYEDVLAPKSDQLMKDILDEAGFPVTTYYPEFVRTVMDANGNPVPKENNNTEVPTPPTTTQDAEPESEEDLPF
jgi:hypothetical protein